MVDKKYSCEEILEFISKKLDIAPAKKLSYSDNLDEYKKKLYNLMNMVDETVNSSESQANKIDSLLIRFDKLAYIVGELTKKIHRVIINKDYYYNKGITDVLQVLEKEKSSTLIKNSIRQLKK